MILRALLFLCPLMLSGCAVIGVTAIATLTAVSVASTGVSIGASGAKTLVTTTSDVVIAPLKKPEPQQ